MDAPASRDRRITTLDGALLSPSRIGDVNRSRVLQALCDHGPLSRAELAKMAGVTRATIGNIANALIDTGLLEEHEPPKAGAVGKPARPLWFTPGAGLSAAAAITAGAFDVALIDARGEVLDASSGQFDAAAKTDGELRDKLIGALDAVMPTGASALLGIGVAIPGVCDTERGVILGSGQVPGLRGRGLVQALTERFEQRVLVDNDARVQALGEKWFGVGRGVPSFASVQTGHGIGVGVVLDGVVYRGPRGEAGELGHTAVTLDGELCSCGLVGCWETIASLRWLQREATTRGIDNAAGLDASQLVTAARDSAAASALLDEYADHLAIGLANLVHVLTPSMFIIHGDVVGGGEELRQRIENAVRARVLPYLRDDVRIVLSDLDQRAGLVGAAALVLSETFRLIS
ncbi:MAG TPA: ROK family transcriptional regulator [Acidimicrobiales bacterium]|nr:ROK family transcriptional regulator [Acidimicrobiales bacterium]